MTNDDASDAVAVIPARGGSKRVLRKNIRDFHGRPMLSWSIEAALASKCFGQVIVSTDDEEIMKIGEEYGAELIERPAYLANSSVLVDEVFAHAHSEVKKRYDNVEMVVILVCNAPNILSQIA